MSIGLGEHRVRLGRQGETFAAEYLERTLGWRIWRRNWRCRLGELDIIGWDRSTLVVVEVRARANERFGPAVSAVDDYKAKQILRILPTLLSDPDLAGAVVMRLDVITLTCLGLRVMKMNHVRNAFDGII